MLANGSLKNLLFKDCMSGRAVSNEETQKLLSEFSKEHGLTTAQEKQFALYLELIIIWNKVINLTAITDPKKIITTHFQDSLAIDSYIDFTQLKAISDVGTGAGFPAIPLKIKYPHLSLILIEVTTKKILFLREIIKRLSLESVEICNLDWRTFLRKTDCPIDLFVTRAALPPKELIRIFSPSCVYNEKMVIYWASKQWYPEGPEKEFVQKEVSYQIGNKLRKFVFLKKELTSD